MNIIYISSLCSIQKYNELFPENKNKGNQQIQKYHRLVVEGLISNKAKVTAVSAPPINTENTKKKLVIINSDLSEQVNFIYLPTVNILVIKHILYFLLSFIRTFLLCLKEKNSVVVCDVLNVSISTGALLASKVVNRKSIAIVTDLPEMQTINPNKCSVKFNNLIIRSFSSFVFLTKQMSNVINKKKRPFVVIEGQVDVNMKDILNQITDKHEKKIIHYAGGLQKKYGIKTLTEAFIQANLYNAELHLYGRGDFEGELEHICRDHSNIKYFGIMPNEYVVKEQIKSTLLINPRPTNEEYTKYSFPSKNMEYMASGTPILTTKLPGMPEEYYEFIYLLEDESVEGIKNTLENILSKNRKELHERGLKSKDFVMLNKNNIVQAKKIIRMVKSMD
jgi:glycosyltransferase involved in cell wall biosynthesis